MDTHHTTHHIHHICGWFQYQIIHNHWCGPTYKYIEKNYNITIDKKGTKYCGLTLDWDYPDKCVDILIPNYVNKELRRFHHTTTKHPQYASHKWLEP